MSELLDPNHNDIAEIYESEFIQMAEIDVSLEELLSTMERLINDINTYMTENERQFLLSVKNKNPKWELLEMENPDHIAALPSVKWRLFNLEKMSQAKHALAYAKLEAVLYPSAGMLL